MKIQNFAKAGFLLAVFSGLFLSSSAKLPNGLPGAGPDTLKIESGLISGARDKSGEIRVFKGIPYAAPPLGELRWKEPMPAASWTGVRNCSEFSASPMQPKPASFLMFTEEFLIPKEPISEDCLYLNVWTGATKAKEKRPVIVWIYGGGFTSGGTAVPIYNGEAMARKGIVFVSINYRVGIFGFMAHPDLSKESPHHVSGNYGLMDQISAIQWVKKNIAVFGGDPENITVAGQSAGSMSVNCLVASPLCKGLFQKAIAESGATLLKIPLFANNTLLKAEQDGLKIGQSMNAPAIADLRKVPAEELVKKTSSLRGPIVDGYVLPETVAGIFASKKQNDVALLTGWNEDEGNLFGGGRKAEDFKAQIREQYPAHADDLLKLYPAADDAEAARSQGELSRDLIFGAQNYTWASLQSSSGKSKVFVYRFARKVPAEGAMARYGAFHTAEVPYAYNNLQFVNRPFQPVDHELAELMSSYWANFARTGNPSGKSLPEWPAFNQKTNMIMLLAEKSMAEPLPGKNRLDGLSAALKTNQ